MNKKYLEYEKPVREFLEKTGVELMVHFTGTRPYFPDDKESRDVYMVTLKRGNKSYSFEFGDSIHNTERHTLDAMPRKKPGAYDILASVTKYEPEHDLDAFAAEFGIEKPSEAVRVHQAVWNEWRGISSIFSPEELEKLNEIAV